MTRETVASRRARQASAAAELARTPRGVWLGARTPITQPYPCLCWDGAPCDGRPGRTGERWCPCYGRTVVDRLPARCCARVAGGMIRARVRRGDNG